MSEFCLDCWNKLNKANYDAKRFVISKDLELCEGCGEWKQVIIVERKKYRTHKRYNLVYPFMYICHTVRMLWGILVLNCLIYITERKKKK